MITPDEQQADLTTLAYDATSEDLGGAKHFRNLSGVDSLGDEPPFLQENTTDKTKRLFRSRFIR